MGLFNRNKGDAPAPAAPEAGSPADTSTFDFDAISRDLDAHNGASSFDALLAAPATNAPQTSTDNSALDFPDDPLGLSAPSPHSVPVTGSVPIVASPEAVINAPMSSTMPTTGVAQPQPAITAPAFTPTETPRAKKSLPLVPLLGALGLLAVAGGGAMFLLNSNQSTDEPLPDAPPRASRPAPGALGAPPAPGVAMAPGVPGAPPAAMAPGAPGVPPASTTTAPGAPETAPVAPPAGLRSASPGIAPATRTAPRRPAQAPASTGMVAKMAQPPAVALGRGPSATAGLDPALASKLKQLWKTGAEAKRRHDYKTARAAWTEALKLRPTHPGFQDSIDKLPS